MERGYGAPMTASPVSTASRDGSRGRAILLLAAVAIVARAITFGNPIVHVDEEFYFVTAHAWLGGAWPYVDLWDRKPVGLFLLFVPAAALGFPAGILAYQAMALAAVVATAWLAVRIARAAGWGAAALPAGVGYILWLNLADGQGGQSPVFYNLLVAIAARLLIDEDGVRMRRAAAAMALVGIALQIKATVVFEGMFFGLWAMARHWHRYGRLLPTIALGAGLAAIAAMPTIAAAAAYAAIGALPEWSYANIGSILARRADPIAESIGNLATVCAILAPLIGMAAVTIVEARRRGETMAQTFVFGWLAMALFGLLLFGTWFNHYALPVMLPACIVAAGAMVLRPRLWRWGIAGLALAGFAGQVLLFSKRAGRGSPGEFAALARTIGKGPGCLYVYSGSTMLYPATGRCRVSRWTFPSHLSRTREEGAIGIDQAREVRRILATRPAVIVMRPPYRGERPEIRAIVIAALARGYRPVATLPIGREQVRVFSATSPS